MIVTQVSQTSEGEVRLKSESYVCGLIMNEIRNNDGLKISVMCRNGVKASVSRLLLAVLSPDLAVMMKQIDTEDLSLTLPDLDITYLELLLTYALEGLGEEEEELLGTFDGIFWDSGFYSKGIKKEDLSDDANADGYVKPESLDNELPYQNLNEARILRYDVRLKNLPSSDVLQQSSDKLDVPSKTLGNCADFSNPFVDEPQNMLDSFDIGDEFYKAEDPGGEVTLENVKNNVTLSSKSKSISTKKRKLAEEKDQVRSKLGKRGGVIISPDDELLQGQDDDFQTSQEKLREDLENMRNLEDPCLLWYRYHGLDPRIMKMRHQVKQPPLVCPVCYLFIEPQNNKGSYGTRLTSFFDHMRKHKYDSYSCACKTSADSKIEHLKLVHWQWKRCSLCSRVIDPLQEVTHMWCSHKQRIVCQICGQVVVYSGYPNHNDMHILKRPCEFCNKTFSSARKREHHVQVEHKKEKLGCDKCFYLCSNVEDLNKHKEKHDLADDAASPEKSDTPERAVCDICGISVTKNGYNHHYKRHDNTAVECKICRKVFKKYQLSAHMGTHKRGVCTICGKEVGRLCLKSHMKTFHTPLDQLKNKCDVCKKGFPTITALKSHNMNVHLKLRPYKCRYGCEFAYNDGSNRNQHEKKKHGQIFTALDKKEGLDSS